MRKSDESLEQIHHHQKRVLQMVIGVLICLGGVVVIVVRPEAIETGLFLVVTGAGIVDPSTLIRTIKGKKR